MTSDHFETFHYNYYLTFLSSFLQEKEKTAGTLDYQEWNTIKQLQNCKGKHLMLGMAASEIANSQIKTVLSVEDSSQNCS